MNDALTKWLSLTDKFSTIGLAWPEVLLVTIQLVVIGYLLWNLYIRIRGSQAEKILSGVVIVGVIIAGFYIFNFRILTKLFELLLPALSTGLIVLFAPELRRFLHRLGRDGFSWTGLLSRVSPISSVLSEDEKLNHKQLVEEIINALIFLSRNKIGALIIFDITWSDRLYISTGRKLDALISTELLLNIFYPKSPLHDGAVLILNQRVASASLILPITENPKLNPWQYGTRHRAALGISEQSPSCLCLVVSEETGSVSVAEQGKISKVSNFLENPHQLNNTIEKKLLEGT